MAFGFGFSFPHALGGGFTPASLFTAGEQGAWYDPAEFSTLFQDSAGTTPVTAVEQAVGLMLDKSKGLVSAAVTVTNGGFDADSDWTKGTGWSIGSGVATKSAGTAANLTQTIATTTGQWYRVTATLTRTAGGITVSLGTSGTTSGSVTAAGTYTWYILAGSSTQTLTFAADASFAGTVDNVSVNSVSGNHAYQSTSTSRPTLRARYNLLTYSEQFDNAAWGNVTLGTGVAPTVTANQGAAPDGSITADRLQFSLAGGTTTGDITRRVQSYTASAVQHTFSIYLKSFDGASTYNMHIVGSDGSTTNIVVTGTWQRFAVTVTASGTLVYYAVGLRGGQSPANSNTADVLAWGADLRVANDGVGIPAYQRIAAATDYDTAGFPVYLDFCESFGGTNTDNSLLTNSIDFSGTDKMTVFAGVRKLSDAATSILIELSGDVGTNNGSFYITAPTGPSGANYRFASKGTAQSNATSTTAFTPPITNIVTGISSISADQAILRVNEVQNASSTADQGTGNFGNYPLYIGRRLNSGLPFSGRLFSLIVRGATTSDAQIASTEAWVNGRTKAY